MRHGRNARTGDPCLGMWVTVTMGNRSTQAVAGCTCGLASYEDNSIETAVRDLIDEQRSLELDVPEHVSLEPIERDIEAEAEYFGQSTSTQAEYAPRAMTNEEPF